MAEPIFYRCKKCGNLVLVVNKGTCVPQCCGEPMEELKANTTDAATEKHVPAIEHTSASTITATVGSVEHPMLPEHYIQWIALATEDKTVVKYLKPGDKPQVLFHLAEGKQGTVYEYCNLHGLWKAEA